MNPDKQRRLEKAGWTVGTTAEFLRLAPAEDAIVHIRRTLAHMIIAQRTDRGWSKRELAAFLGAPQSHIHSLESGHRVSLDDQFAALLALGVAPRDIAAALGEVPWNTGTPSEHLLIETRS